MRYSSAVVENCVMRFFLRMNIYRSVKLSPNHVAPVARVERWLGGVGFFCVPDERAESARVPFTIAATRPVRFITGLRMIVPDERLPVSRALITSLAERDICEH